MDVSSILFHAHSGLRFLVLLAAVVAVAVLARGWSARRPLAGAGRVWTAVFLGALDLQVLLGLALLMTRPFYGALVGHLVMALAAVGAGHALAVFARGQADARRANAIALAGVVLALLLVLGAISAIGRTPFQTTRPAAAAGAVR
jgi:hypothetical protein